MKIYLASHGDFSKGCYDTLSMIMGEDLVKEIVIYSLERGKTPVDYVEKFKMELDKKEIYIVFTDLYGGSVFNAFAECLELGNVHIVAGTNINVLIEFLLSTEQNIEKRISNAINNARMGLQSLSFIKKEISDEEF